MRRLLLLLALLLTLATPVAGQGVLSGSRVQFVPSGPQIRWGAADPSAGAGVAAPVGSLYLRTGTAQMWQKTGAGDTLWTNITTTAPINATYITQTANSTLSAEQALSLLSTGVVKVTTSTGVLSTAVAATDYVAPGAITSSGLTMATARVLCRTTAATGAIEECASVPATLGGLGLTALCADDEALVSNGTVYQCKAVPNCNTITEKLLYATATNTFSCQTDQTASGAGSGDVVGPASATDNAIARFDTTTGKLIQNSVGILSDAGALSGVTVDAAVITSGQVAIAQGGTGQATATPAFDALAPTTTKGDLIVHNGTDNIRVAVGTNTHVLTADSTEASGVKWAVGGGGGLVLLEQQTASASASLNFTTCISSTYDTYKIELVNIIPATDNALLYLRMSTDGGSSYDAGANYNWTGWRFLSTGSGTSGANAAAQITVVIAIDTTASANWSVNGSITLFNPGGAKYKVVTGQITDYDNAANALVGTTLGAAYLSTTAVNAFQFLMSTGNIASGTIRVYGLQK